MWDVLLPTFVDCLDASNHETHHYNMRVRMHAYPIFDVSPQVLGENLVTYLIQYGQILNASSDDLNGVWSFEIILDHKAFIFVPNCLDVE